MRENAENRKRRESSHEGLQGYKLCLIMLRTAGEERAPEKRLQGYKLCVIMLRTAGEERTPEKGLQGYKLCRRMSLLKARPFGIQYEDGIIHSTQRS